MPWDSRKPRRGARTTFPRYSSPKISKRRVRCTRVTALIDGLLPSPSGRNSTSRERARCCSKPKALTLRYMERWSFVLEQQFQEGSRVAKVELLDIPKWVSSHAFCQKNLADQRVENRIFSSASPFARLTCAAAGGGMGTAETASITTRSAADVKLVAPTAAGYYIIKHWKAFLDAGYDVEQGGE